MDATYRGAARPGLRCAAAARGRGSVENRPVGTAERERDGAKRFAKTLTKPFRTAVKKLGKGLAKLRKGKYADIRPEELLADEPAEATPHGPPKSKKRQRATAHPVSSPDARPSRKRRGRATKRRAGPGARSSITTRDDEESLPPRLLPPEPASPESRDRQQRSEEIVSEIAPPDLLQGSEEIVSEIAPDDFGMGEDISFSSEELVPEARPVKYLDLAKSHIGAEEQVSSVGFTNRLLAGNWLVADMIRARLAPPDADPAALASDRAWVRDALQRVWGWTAEEVAYYYDDRSGTVKNTAVEYLTSPQARAQFAVRPGSTLLYGDPPQTMDTSGMVSKASGTGFAIFAMDAEGNIYAGQHKVGLFHHSSFMGGKDVAAAGEMKVLAGKLIEVTAKSGHYTPTLEQTRQLVQQLGDAGVPLQGVLCKLWIKDPNGAYTTAVVDAEDLRLNGARAKHLATEVM